MREIGRVNKVKIKMKYHHESSYNKLHRDIVVLFFPAIINKHTAPQKVVWFNSMLYLSYSCGQLQAQATMPQTQDTNDLLQVKTQ